MLVKGALELYSEKAWTCVQNGRMALHNEGDMTTSLSGRVVMSQSKQWLSFTRAYSNLLHDVTVMQGLPFQDSLVTLFKSASWYVLSAIELLVARELYIGNVRRECNIGKSRPHQPCETPCHPKVFELSLL